MLETLRQDLRHGARMLMKNPGFAAIAIVSIAIGVGVYGLVAYRAGQRTREIGIRMAIGAHPGPVVRMVLRRGLVLSAAGVAVDLAASIAAGGLLRGVFPGQGTIDVTTYALVVPASSP